MARKFARPRRYLVIMAKSPRLGLAKRRLGAEIGDIAALRFYRNCLNRSCSRLGSDPRWQTLLAVTPDREIFRALHKAQVISVNACIASSQVSRPAML